MDSDEKERMCGPTWASLTAGSLFGHALGIPYKDLAPSDQT